MPAFTRTLAGVVITILVIAVAPWPIQQPSHNIWKLLAQSLGREDICLATGAADDPLGTCLVGIPLLPEALPFFLNPATISGGLWKNPPFQFLPWLDHDPLEFTLLGAAKASFCFQFTPTQIPGDWPNIIYMRQDKKEFTAKRWCRALSTFRHFSTSDGGPRALPKGFFLICGNRAWEGIPTRLVGGPCTLGRLTLFSPNTTEILNWQTNDSTEGEIRRKRQAKPFDSTCDPEITHWPKTKRIAMSVLLPWVAAAKTLGELGELECWAAKQANLTSATLSDLLQDEQITRQATLQNRAALDYLLLLHHHSCREFRGLCCFDLRSSAQDAQAKIKEMKDHVSRIKEEPQDWLYQLFSGSGLSNWAISIVKDLLYVLIIFIIVSLSAAVLWKCLKNIIQKLTDHPQVNAVLASPLSPLLPPPAYEEMVRQLQTPLPSPALSPLAETVIAESESENYEDSETAEI